MTEKEPLIWCDEREWLTIPGEAGRTFYFDDTRWILQGSWRLASWLPPDACVSFERFGNSEPQEVHRPCWPWEDDPDGTVKRIPRGWNHDHCRLCNEYIDWNDLPVSAAAYYNLEDENWICRECRDTVMNRRDEIERGLRERGWREESETDS